MPDMIRFLKGEQSALNTKMASASPGFTPSAFYLTTDTGRLYYATTANKLLPLNQYIRTVTSTEFNALTSADVAIGDYYYISDSNILAINNTGDVGHTGDWTQLNPDTNTTYTFTETAPGKITVTAYNRSGATLGTQDITIHTDGKSIGTADEWIKINSASNGIHLYHETKTAASVNYGIANAAQEPAANSTFNILTGIEVDKAGHISSVSTGTVKIPAATVDSKYTLSNTGTVPAAAIYLKGTGGDTNTYKVVVSANNGLTTTVTGAVANDHNGSIIFSHASKPATGTALTPSSAAEGISSAGRKFTALTGISLDTYGHVATVNSKEFTLPAPIDIASVTANSAGQIVIGRTQDGAAVASITSGQDLYYTITYNDDASATTIYNKNSLGNLTTKTYVNTQITSAIASLERTFDAMTYKGTATTSAGLVTGDVHNGDTWKASAIFTIPAANSATNAQVSVKVGDLIIAKGTENSSGVLAAPKFEVVPSGDEPTYNLTADTSTKTIKLAENAGGTVGYTGSIKFAGDTWLTPSVASVNSSTQDYTVTYSHAAPGTGSAVTTSATTSATTSFGQKFTALVGAESDTKGHITKVITREFALPSLPSIAHDLHVISTGLQFTYPNNSHNNIAISAGTGIVITPVTTAGNESITFAHETYNTSVTAATSAAVGYGEKITAVVSATCSNGHVTGITTKEFQLPAKVSYSISSDVTTASNTATIKHQLSGSSTSSADFAITSTNLTVSSSSKTVSINFEWGTF